MGLRSGKKRSSTLFRSLFVLSSDRALFSRDRTRNTTDEIFFCRIESDGVFLLLLLDVAFESFFSFEEGGGNYYESSIGGKNTLLKIRLFRLSFL